MANDNIIAIHNDHIQPPHDYLNYMHPDVQWSKENKEDRRTATKMEHSISISTENPHTHIPFDSHTPLSHKSLRVSIIHSLTRAELIQSTEENNPPHPPPPLPPHQPQTSAAPINTTATASTISYSSPTPPPYPPPRLSNVKLIFSYVTEPLIGLFKRKLDTH